VELVHKSLVIATYWI